MDDSHRCPIEGCRRDVPDYQLMRRGHWSIVPSDLARALYRAWSRGAGQGTERHATAMRSCIDAVHVKLAREA
jgi:hypothetical protein